MPRADFYLIDTPRFADQPLRLVCELARRGYDTGQPLLILVRDAAQAALPDNAPKPAAVRAAGKDGAVANEGAE